MEVPKAINKQKYTKTEIDMIIRKLFTYPGPEMIAEQIENEIGYYDEYKALKLLRKMEKIIKANIKELYG